MKNIVKALALALIVVFAFTSCAKQPTALMDGAKAAIQSVIDAKGGVYAKEELNKLQGDLQAALDAVTAQAKKFFKKYGPAKEMLNQVIADAESVKALIPGRIAEAKQAAETTINEAKMAVEEATALIEKAPKGKGTRADIEAMKADLAGLSTAMADVDSAMMSEDYILAQEKAAAIKEQATSVIDQINAAIAKVRR
jgi:chaperonin cofactor prefoldin